MAILGAGKIAARHAEGYQAAGGFQLAAVADLIPGRRRALAATFGTAAGTREVADASELVADANIDAVSICLPNHLHLPAALAALKAGKHVVCETPPALSAVEAKRLASAAAKSGKVLLYAAQARFGANERAARLAIEKGYAGDLHHARAAWMRTRAIPAGASFAASGSIDPGAAGVGWYADKSRSGGGVLMDLGCQILDVAHDLLGRPKPISVFATTGNRFTGPGGAGAATGAATSAGAAATGWGFPGFAGTGRSEPVEDTLFALMRFEGGKTLELSAAWAINQPPHQNGKICRLHGDRGAIDLYTRQGPVLYRDFNAKGEVKETLMKLPKVVQYPAMMRHFKDCIHGKDTPLVGPEAGLLLMQMVDAIYKSAAGGKSAEVR